MILFRRRRNCLRPPMLFSKHRSKSSFEIGVKECQRSFAALPLRISAAVSRSALPRSRPQDASSFR
jgi:hypothetical protein